MSTAKVIFTYKRKRLSSCSGDGLECPNFSSDVPIGKHQNAAEERSDKPKEDVKIFNHDDVNLSVNCDSCIEPYNLQHVESRRKHTCQGESFFSTCSSPQGHRSSIPKESSHVEESDTVSIREAMLSCNELARDNTSKALNVSAGASLVKFHNSAQRDSYLDLNSSCVHEEDTEPKQSLPVYSGAGKAKLSTPLLTFSRRLKRKADTGNEDTKINLPTREGTISVKDNKPTCVSSCSCEVTSNKSRLGEGCVNLTVASDDANTMDVFCQDKEEAFSKEIGTFPCSCTRPRGDSVILRQTKGEKCSMEDLNVDSSANAKQILADTANFSKENVECSSSIGIGVSYGDDTSKTNNDLVSNKLQRASSGDSQLTSTDGSDSKMVARKTAKEKAPSSSLNFSGPPPGGFVIDCNMIPESNLEEQASAIIHDSFGMEKKCENLVQEGHLKTKSLELFRDNDVEADDLHLGNGKSSKDACTPLEADSKRNNKLLQLFSTDDGKSCRFPPADIRSKVNCSKAEENSTFSSDSRKNWHEQSSRRASAFNGLFTQTEPIVGQPSRHGSGVHPFQQPGFFTQNPMFPPFPDHSSYTFRHKLLLETINSKASALRVNMNLSLDKFEPCPIVWLEEELDSLWKGVRRHGRGNWHAMLLDPRLHFSPWRTTRDLADQWEREQCNLLSGQQMPQGKYSNLPQPCNLDCNGGFSCPRATGIMRGSVVAETQLSLGDVYAQKGSAPSYGIIPAHNNHLRMASCGLAMNNNNNNWLREPFGSLSKSTEAAMAMPSISGLAQMGGPQIVNPFADPSGTSCGPKNLSMRKRVVKNNVIVIDSDASSEETVSDDRNVRM